VAADQRGAAEPSASTELTITIDDADGASRCLHLHLDWRSVNGFTYRGDVTKACGTDEVGSTAGGHVEVKLAHHGPVPVGRATISIRLVLGEGELRADTEMDYPRLAQGLANGLTVDAESHHRGRTEQVHITLSAAGFREHVLEFGSMRARAAISSFLTVLTRFTG
jgi:hypothetical protein